MGPFDKILVGVQVHKAQGHAAVLAVAQNLALVAQAQVHLGERKAVRGLFERLETVLCRRRATVALGVRHDQASARHAAAAHAAAQLVQGKTYQAFMPYVGIAVLYLAMVMILSGLMGLLERRMRASD